VTNTQIVIRGFHLRATDGLIVGTLALFSLLALAFCWRVEGWWMLIVKNLVVAAAYLAFIRLSDRATGKFLRFFLRVAAVTLSYAYLFGAVDKLQMIIHGQWMDNLIIGMEDHLFGVQPTVWFQQYVSRPLTEWMMFSYVVYVPLYPVLCGIVYYKKGDLAMEDYFFTLGFTNILCDIGFILFPVASPMYWIRDQFTVPLDGYVWTYLGELMRTHLHFAGGSIPSPHAAAATIMWAMAYRYHRPSFWVMSPVIISLYISTFYARYHYLTDAVVGVFVAFIALVLAPILMRLWDRIAESRRANA
jgi:membrane-associated phospholipid phosphatase